MTADPSLPDAPPDLADEAGRPRFGKYRGSLPRVDLAAVAPAFRPGGWVAWARRKRWAFCTVATPEVLLGFAAVDLGYAANGFVYAVDLREGEHVVDHTAMALPGLGVRVGDRPGEGFEARFAGGGIRGELRRPPGGAGLGLEVVAPGLRWEATLEAAAPALTVIAPTPEERFHVTQKEAGLPVRGSLELGTREVSLDGGAGGLDVSLGFPPRHTAWRWAMGNGRLDDGTTVGFNLTEGFNEAEGVDESALWIGRELIPLGPARFEEAREGRRRVRSACGGLELDFREMSDHRERRDYGLVRADFRQAAGVFRGRFLHGTREVELPELAGVVEDQDVRW